MQEQIIDLNLGASLVGKDAKFAKEMINTLVNTFPDELKKLEAAHKKEDWATIKDVIHRIKGAVSYCGTPRLQKIATELLHYLHSSEIKDREKLYQAFLAEITAVSIAYQTL